MLYKRFLEICEIVHEEALKAGYIAPEEEKKPVLLYRNFGKAGGPRIEVIEHYHTRSQEKARTVIMFQDANDPTWFICIEVEKLTNEEIRARFKVATELFFDHQKK